MFDELAELRSWLRPGEIAEILGLRPETLSRLKPGHKLSRKTERLVDDLYNVAWRLRLKLDDPTQLRFALNRRRSKYGARSFASY